MNHKRIRVISPSGPCDIKKLIKSKHYLESLGYNIELSKNAGRKEDYLAGSDEERFEDLKEALLNKDIDIIWMSRGGYGSMRILEKLNNIKVIKPKTLIGYSDTTTLFCWASRLKSITCLYGPSFSELCDKSNYNFKTLFHSIRKEHFKVECKGIFKKNSYIKIQGGCLSLMVSLMGTEYFPDMRGRFLLLEDINEPLYRIDRMLMQLKLGKVFEKVEGVIIGSFNRIENGNFRKVAELIKRCAGESKPVLINRKIGHCKEKITIPLEKRALWDGKYLCF